MDRYSLYYKAHLIVAAIRLVDHQKGVPPSIVEIGQATGYSIEEIQSICNNLKEKNILTMVLAGAVERIYIKNPTPIEELPRIKQGPDMEKEVAKFAEKQRVKLAEISVKAKSEKQRKKDLFAALEKQLKGNAQSEKKSEIVAENQLPDQEI